MKPAWDKLGDEYKSSKTVLIGDVDCTKEQDLCQKYGVQGYPTIKYFTAETPETGSDYSGGRDFDGLKKFVEDTLEVKCLLDNTEGCSDKEKDFMSKWKDKDKADAKAQYERLNGMKGNSMAPDLKKWVMQRISILKQIVEA